MCVHILFIFIGVNRANHKFSLQLISSFTISSGFCRDARASPVRHMKCVVQRGIRQMRRLNVVVRPALGEETALQRQPQRSKPTRSSCISRAISWSGKLFTLKEPSFQMPDRHSRSTIFPKITYCIICLRGLYLSQRSVKLKKLWQSATLIAK